MSDAESDASGPPPANGQATSASNLRQQGLWGRGVNATKGKGSSKADANGEPRSSIYAPISMLELELRTRNAGDGASSVAGSEDDEEEPKKKKRKRENRKAKDYEDDEEEGEERADGHDPASMMAGAAFGVKEGALSVMSDSEDGASVTSSEMAAAQKRAFPVSGVSCVGCAMSSRITAVDDFVHANCSKMGEVALFKMAALHYCVKVVEPARAEGVVVPPWPWKDVRAHYQLHVVDTRMQRFENARTLGAVRKVLELQLLRQDAETGEQTLDKTHFEGLMKVIGAQSRELTFLSEMTPSAPAGSTGSTPGKKK